MLAQQQQVWKRRRVVVQELAHAIRLPERRELGEPIGREQERPAAPQAAVFLAMHVEIE